ncbi:MAG TPA: hypothetical protein VHG89_08170 [Verrucomicrobiae bacterium]|nr:hypothetical protein [Verrucomicrobiae bacterium]
MTQEFLQLCTEVDRDTAFFHEWEKCLPHFQNVLDYIQKHPEERNSIIDGMSRSLMKELDAPQMSIYLLQFLAKSLRWPEIKKAAEHSYQRDVGGGSSFSFEVKNLLKIYDESSSH